MVFDTFVEDLPQGFFENRPWNVGDNPKTAVRQYLKDHPEFEIDKKIDTKLMVTVAPNGFLLRK
ncbi:Cephalosporin hydroxylase [compost metagenome]